MAESTKAITWEAPEHNHIEKESDWYWALGIIAVAAAGFAVVIKNTLFAIVILLGAVTMALFAMREPKLIPFGVTARGIQVGTDLYPYTTLESYHLDDEDPLGPQLFVKSQHLFAPLIILPVPDEHVDEIEAIIASKLPEEHLEEPFSNKLLEFFGF